MYKTQNGWTKARMIEQIQSKMLDHVCADERMTRCLYQANDGNRCAAGVFFPDGHPALDDMGTFIETCLSFPDLEMVVPLDREAMRQMQMEHDGYLHKGGLIQEYSDPRKGLVAWINENVEDAA